MLLLENPEHFRLRAGTSLVSGKHIRSGTFGARLQNRALALLPEVLEELGAVVGEIAERDEQSSLLIVVVIAQRPHDARQRRILPVPGTRSFFRRERALDRLGGSTVAERLIEPADSVVRRRQEHQITGRPGVEVTVSKDSRHAKARHLLHVVPADHLPLVGEERIEPRVIRAVANGVVVEVRNRFMQVVEHLRLPTEIGVEDVLRQLERERHRIAIVVVADVVSPVEQRGIGVSRVRHVPPKHVYLAITAVDFHDGSDERDEVVADVSDVRALIDGEAVRQLHQRRRRPRFRRVDRARDVVDRRRLVREPGRFRIVHVDASRISELRKVCLVLLEIREH